MAVNLLCKKLFYRRLNTLFNSIDDAQDCLWHRHKQITWRERLEAYYYLCRFDKPIGTELVFWPTMWALWIASQGMPCIEILIPMILGMIFMRAAGCAINDFADRKVDGHVERTKNRPLATGVISAKEACMYF